MTDEELRLNLDNLERYEGRVSWLYLDSAVKPNATTGVGCLIASVQASLTLPWHRVETGEPATASEIVDDFSRVIALRGGMLAKAYKGRIRLSNQNIDKLAFYRMRAMLDQLPKVFRGFDNYPTPVKRCLLDLAWNNGIGRSEGAKPATGMHGWTRLRKACAERDWQTAAKECVTANPQSLKAREKRNAWRVACFVETQKVA